MAGPYFENQKPGACGCFYPDIIPMREEGVVVYNCVEHGEVRKAINSKAMVGEQRKVTEKWRETQREKMRKMSPSQMAGVLKTRQFVKIRSVGIIVETDDGAFLKTYKAPLHLMTYEGKDGVVHEDSDNLVVQADVRFLNPKFIQEPSGWVFQPRARDTQPPAEGVVKKVL